MPLLATRQAARRAAHQTTLIQPPRGRLGVWRFYSTQDAAVAPSSAEAESPKSDPLKIFITKAQDATSNMETLPVSFAVKDNIATWGLPTSCGSAFLQDYVSPLEATVVTRYKQSHGQRYEVMGKTNMDEFGMGSHSTNSHFGAVHNPCNDYSAGGSSGGSAVAVATGLCDTALGTDTGGSIRLPAAYTGTVGFKPSYGMVSRCGVIPYANSLDTVGLLAPSVTSVVESTLLTYHDGADPTSATPGTRKRVSSNKQEREAVHLDTGSPIPYESLRIGVPLEYNIEELHPVVRQAWIETLEALRSKGCTIVPISLPSTKQSLSAYYIIAAAEAASNLSKYDGVRYGNMIPSTDGSNDVLYSVSRGRLFGDETKRRILLGSYTLSSTAIDNYFIKAQKIRRLVQRDFDRVFVYRNPLRPQDEQFDLTDMDESIELNNKLGPSQVDVILCPTAPTLAPTLEHVRSQTPVQSYMNDVFTVPASLAGLPAISVPWSVPQKHSEPKRPSFVGIQIIGQYSDDLRVLAVASLVEKLQDGNVSPSTQTIGQPLVIPNNPQLGETESQRLYPNGKEAVAKSASTKEIPLRSGDSILPGHANAATPNEQTRSIEITQKIRERRLKNKKRLAKLNYNNDPLYQMLILNDVPKEEGVIKIRKVVPKNAKPFCVPKGVPAQYLKEWESRERKKASETVGSKENIVKDHIFKITSAHSLKNKRQRRTAKYHAKSLIALNIPHAKFTEELELKYDVPRDQLFKQLEVMATNIKEERKGFQIYIESAQGSKIRIVGYRLSGKRHLRIRKYSAQDHRRPMKTSLERYYQPLRIRKYTPRSRPGWRWIKSYEKFKEHHEEKIGKILKKDNINSSLSKWESLLEAEMQKTNSEDAKAPVVAIGSAISTSNRSVPDHREVKPVLRTLGLYSILEDSKVDASESGSNTETAIPLHETKNFEFTANQVAKAMAKPLVTRDPFSRPDLKGLKSDLQRKTRKGPKSQEASAETSSFKQDSERLNPVLPVSETVNKRTSLNVSTPAPKRLNSTKKPREKGFAKVKNTSDPVASSIEKSKSGTDPKLSNPESARMKIINKLRELLRR